MRQERFEALAQAYGGEIARWPDAVREAAALFAAAAPEVATLILSREGRLDAVLDAAPRTSARSGLFEQIVLSAPAGRRRRRWSVWIAPARLGAGLAATALVGVLLGAQMGASTSNSAESANTSVAELDVSAVTEGV